MKYFLKYSYYIIMSIAFTLIISLLVNGIKLELFPIILINLYLLRILDDYFDYDTDKKEKLLNKKIIKIIAYVLSVLFVVLNVLFYGYYGLISIVILIYILIENKFEILKIFLLFLTSLFYISMYSSVNTITIIIYLVVTVVLSISYYIYKRRKNDL